jgi:transcriptional regulator with XRE-family HTH domain
MTFTEKLRTLTDGENKARLSRAAGLYPTAIVDYLQRGHIPRADNALALARVLKVPFEWLIDDQQGMPPPAAGELKASSLSDAGLMREVCQRYRVVAVRIWNDLKAAIRINWTNVAAVIKATPTDKDLPLEIDAAIELSRRIEPSWRMLRYFDPSHAAAMFQGDIPGGDIDPSQLTARWLAESAGKLNTELPGYHDAATADYERLSKRFPIRKQEPLPDDVEELIIWGKAMRSKPRPLPAKPKQPIRPKR